MARDLVLDVIARKNSRDLSTLADEFDRLAKRTDDAGRKMHQTGTFSQFLDEEIAKTRVQVRGLREEFEQTGDKDVFAKLRGSMTNLRSLERIKTDLAKALKEGGESGGDEAGRSFAERFRDRLLGAHDWGRNAGSGFTEGFTSGIKPGLIGAAILAGAMVTPGVVLAATGLAGIGLGIVGQLRNPAIKDAAGQAGHEIMDALGRDTAPLQGPIISALQTIGHSAESALGQIDFGSMGKEIEGLASGIGGLVDRMMPGFNKALEAAQPVIDTLSADLPLLGDAVSQMFEDFSKGGRGAQESIHLLMATLAGFAFAIGKTVLAISNLVEHITAGGERLSWWAAAITHNIPIIGAWTNGVHNMWNEIQRGSVPTETVGRAFHEMGAKAALTAEQMDALSAKINETKTTADTLAGSLASKVFNSMMSVDQATLSWHQSLTALGQTLTRANHSIDENTEKGQANRQAILSAVTANMAQYQAQIAVGMSAQDAAHAYDENTQALERQLRKAGLTQKEIDGLIGKYAAVPDDVNTDIAANGLTEAINNLGSLLARLNHLDGRDFGFTVTEIDIRRRINEDMGHTAHGGNIRGYAGGGRVIEVGEMGRELLTLPALSAPAYVTPNSTLNGAANSANGGDLGTITVVVQSDTGEDLIRKIVTVGRRTNRTTFDTLLPVKTSR